MNSFDQVLWCYIGFLLAGGLVGFLKAGSRASLIASRRDWSFTLATLTFKMPAGVGTVTNG